jgi:class 3 adenylate cyclase
VGCDRGGEAAAHALGRDWTLSCSGEDGIGIHGGDVLIGDIGYRNRAVFTAIGDAETITNSAAEPLQPSLAVAQA